MYTLVLSYRNGEPKNVKWKGTWFNSNCGGPSDWFIVDGPVSTTDNLFEVQWHWQKYFYVFDSYGRGDDDRLISFMNMIPDAPAVTDRHRTLFLTDYELPGFDIKKETMEGVGEWSEIGGIITGAKIFKIDIEYV